MSDLNNFLLYCIQAARNTQGTHYGLIWLLLANNVHSQMQLASVTGEIVAARQTASLLERLTRRQKRQIVELRLQMQALRRGR